MEFKFLMGNQSMIKLKSISEIALITEQQINSFMKDEEDRLRFRNAVIEMKEDFSGKYVNKYLELRRLEEAVQLYKIG